MSGARTRTRGGEIPERARRYDAWFETPLGRVVERVERTHVLELADPRPGERILDAGCGTGISSVWLAVEGTELTGIDRDPDLLVAARAKLPEARFVEGDVRRLPFPDGSFDLVAAVTLLCFLDGAGRRDAVRELVRVTRPGGRVVLGELARWSAWALERRVRGWAGSASWRTARFTTGAELARLLRIAGSSVSRTRHALYLPPLDRPGLVARAGSIERFGRRLGALGAAFVVVRAEKPRPKPGQVPIR